MNPSLLKAKKRLAPLAWLLALAVLAPASAHVAQGLVLCIGSGHVDIEVAGPAHHDGISGWAASSNGSLASLTYHAPAFQEAGEEYGSPCLDVPLRIARAADTCHQAVKSEAPEVAPLAFIYPAVSLETDDAADSHPLPRSVLPLSFQERSHSTVVLLI